MRQNFEQLGDVDKLKIQFPIKKNEEKIALNKGPALSLATKGGWKSKAQGSFQKNHHLKGMLQMQVRFAYALSTQKHTLLSYGIFCNLYIDICDSHGDFYFTTY